MAGTGLRFCVCVFLGMTGIDAVAQPALTPRHVELQISRHAEVEIDEAEVDQILAVASRLLQDRDGSDDTACPLSVTRKGPITVLDSKVLPAEILTYGHMLTAAQAPGDLKLVRSIGWCGGTGSGTFYGCAEKARRTMVVVPLGEIGAAGVLWAHELSHTHYIDHVNEPQFRLMLSWIEAAHRRIDRTECERLVQPLLVAGAGAIPENQIDVQPLSQSRIVAPPAAQPDIRSFARRIWVHDIPLEAASRYTLQDADVLVQLLRDDRERLYWVNAVLLIGMIGAPDHASALIEFYGSRSGELDISEYRAKSAVPRALGMLSARVASPQANAFLLRLSNPNTPIAAWTPPGVKDMQIRDRLQAQQAAIGLALSGREAAGRRLNDIRQSIERGAFSLNTGSGEPLEFIEQLQNTRARIQSGGLGSYLNEAR